MADAAYSRRQTLRTAGLGAAGLVMASALRRGALAAGSQDPMPGAAAVAGRLEAWDWSDAPYVPGEEAQADFYTKYFPSLYKNLKFSSTILGYTDMLPKLTVAWRASNRPDVARVAIAWSPQFVGADQCAEITEQELGIPFDQFLPGALLSVRRDGAGTGPLYGLPTNNEVMFLLYNKAIFSSAGLDPEKPPATWEDLAAYSKTIHDKTGNYGYGLCAAQNNGNTPFRFMPAAWAYGGQIFDELSPHPTWRTIGLGDQGTVAALALYNRMFNIDKSVQPSALSDNESNVETLFLDGKVAMCIDHPSFAQQVRQLKPDLPVGGAMVPSGPVRRAVVLGGSNIHIRATSTNKAAALALIRAYLSPYWNARLGTGAGSEASTAAARRSHEQGLLSKEIPFNDIVFKMLPYGVNVPLVAEGAQIWNAIVPQMIQEVLSGRSTPKDAASAAAGQVRELMAG
ncbi:MAG TPA: sugar ABC transporter substrate-binding protein [Acetobacteraceae bacterium]|nr:sugar ABC transporter substrate-binding protein [Acetobacteraceae bacterium]